MTLTRRQATIGGATLLAGTSMGTLAQRQGWPLKRAVEDVEEQEKVRRAERLTPRNWPTEPSIAAPWTLGSGVFRSWAKTA